MNCEAIRNRLLAQPNPNRVPAELRPHVTDCRACREFLVRYDALARNIQSLSVPESERTKMAFLDSINHTGPIIRNVPGTPVSTFSGKKFARRLIKPLASIAAAVAVGFGVWAISGSRKGPAEVVAPRYDLLKKVVVANANLARSNDPKVRIATLTELTTDIRKEAGDVVKAADEDDLVALAAMFEKVVDDGLVNQAKQLNPMTVAVADRQRVLNDAAEKLAATADDVAELYRNAPPHAKASLSRIQEAAAQGRVKLLRIAGGEGS